MSSTPASGRFLHKGAARGFTLIELLVVISIIALLIAILLPALGAARTSARTLKCATQLRQVHMGLLNYAYDNKGLVPYAASGGTAGNAGQWTWASQLTLMGNYITTNTLFWCEERESSWYRTMNNVTSEYDWRWWYTGYAINYYGVAADRTDAYSGRINIDDNRIPSSELLTLSESWHTAYYATRDGWYRIVPSLASTVNPGMVPFLHGKTVNASYLDGHVKTQQAEDIGFNTQTRLWTYAVSADRQTKPWYYLVFEPK